MGLGFESFWGLGFGVQVRLLEFSPGEKFLVTYSTHEPAGPREKQVGVKTQYRNTKNVKLGMLM